jgi:hypothetical protein
MAVFNIAANQVLPQPVTSMYQGKAMRIALENDQLKNQAMQQEIEAFPQQQEMAKKELEIKEANAAAALQNAQTSYAKELREATDTNLEGQRDMWARTHLMFQGAMEQGNQEEARSMIASALMESKAVDSEDELDQALQVVETVGPDRFFRSMYSTAESVLKEKPPSGSARNVLLPDGTRQSAIENDKGELIDPETGERLPKGTTMISQNITTDDPSGLTGSQAGRRLSLAMDSYEGSATINESITDVLPKIIETPGVAGTSGKFAEFVGASATYLLGEEAGDRAAELFSGANQEDLAKIRTQMQTLRARLRPIVTGEEGARQSESERALANQAIGYIDNIQSITDLAQAYPKVVGAMKQLMVESYVNQYQQAKRHDDLRFPFDLNTQEGLESFMESMAAAGQDEDTAVSAYERLKKIQND